MPKIPERIPKNKFIVEVSLIARAVSFRRASQFRNIYRDIHSCALALNRIQKLLEILNRKLEWKIVSETLPPPMTTFVREVRKIAESRGGARGTGLPNIYRQINSCGKSLERIQKLLEKLYRRLDWKIVKS